MHRSINCYWHKYNSLLRVLLEWITEWIRSKQPGLSYSTIDIYLLNQVKSYLHTVWPYIRKICVFCLQQQCSCYLFSNTLPLLIFTKLWTAYRPSKISNIFPYKQNCCKTFVCESITCNNNWFSVSLLILFLVLFYYIALIFALMVFLVSCYNAV